MENPVKSLAVVILSAGQVFLPKVWADTDSCESTAKGVFFGGGRFQVDSDVLAQQRLGSRPKPSSRPVAKYCAPRPPAPEGTTTHEQATRPPVALNSGLAFWVETLRCGSGTSRRTTEYRFVTGDCAKLFFMPNVAGYLYVVNVDSSNKVDYLFPQRGENNLLRAGEDASFEVEFVGAPGIEHVLVMFSRTKIANAPGLALNLADRSKDIVGKHDQSQSVVLTNAAGQASISKSLRRTDEVVSTSAPDAARYVVVADSEFTQLPIMVLNLDLIHTSR